MAEPFDLVRSAAGVEAILAICRRPGRILILMQNNPDPDAIASAAALRELIAVRLKKRSAIGYGGICGRAENRAMLEVLRIDARKVTQAQVARAPIVCLVDAQPFSGNNAYWCDRPVHVVIDHHPLPEKVVWEAEFADVRPDYGAASTILYEYLVAAQCPISTDLATALLYGIRSDTQDLGREVKGADTAAFQQLTPLTDKRKLASIHRAPVPPEYFKALSDSLAGCTVAGTCVISHIPLHANPDMIAEIADLMLRLKGVRTSVCYGLCGTVVHVSARGRDARADVGRRITRVVRRMGTGGGHRTMAGGQVPVLGNAQECLDRVRARILAVFAHNHTPLPLLAPAEAAADAPPPCA